MPAYAAVYDKLRRSRRLDTVQSGLHEMFHTPLSVEDFQQLHNLQDSIANLPQED